MGTVYKFPTWPSLVLCVKYASTWECEYSMLPLPLPLPLVRSGAGKTLLYQWVGN